MPLAPLTIVLRSVGPVLGPITPLGLLLGLSPGVAPEELAPITLKLKQLPPGNRLAYRAAAGDTVIARAEMVPSRSAIFTVDEARCRVTDARTNVLVANVVAEVDGLRLSAPLILPKGIYDVTFAIASEDAAITPGQPIRLLIGPAGQL